MLRTRLADGFHYYNRIDGRPVDLTDSQFSQPIIYNNEPSSREQALAGIPVREYQSLKAAFLQNLAQAK